MKCGRSEHEEKMGSFGRPVNGLQTGRRPRAARPGLAARHLKRRADPGLPYPAGRDRM